VFKTDKTRSIHLSLLRELGRQVSRIEFFFDGKMAAREFKTAPPSTLTTRIQRQPQNHRAHLKIRHLFPGGSQHTTHPRKTRPGATGERFRCGEPLKLAISIFSPPLSFHPRSRPFKGVGKNQTPQLGPDFQAQHQHRHAQAKKITETPEPLN